MDQHLTPETTEKTEMETKIPLGNPGQCVKLKKRPRVEEQGDSSMVTCAEVRTNAVADNTVQEQPQHEDIQDTNANLAKMCAKHGLKVFPLSPGTGKPMQDIGVNDATSDAQTVTEWWNRIPDACVGVACGNKEGLFALEESPENAHEGENSFLNLKLRFDIGQTMEFETAGGGRVLVFLHRGENLQSTKEVLPGVDLLSTGNYLVLPSYTQEGNGREWLQESLPSPSSEELSRELGKRYREARENEDNLQTEMVETVPEEVEPVPEAKQEIFPPPEEGQPPKLPALRRAPQATPCESTPPQLRPLTDSGNRERLSDRHGQDIRYVPQLEKWMHWHKEEEEKGWKLDEDGEIFRRSLETVRSIPEEIRDDMDEELQKQIRAHALRSESKARLTNMVSLAAHDKQLVLHSSQLDANDWLLSVPNGVVDLRTFEHRPARRGDYLTKRAGAPYKKDAECIEWFAFLRVILAGSQELLNYVHRLCGYLLTGSVSERALFLLHGHGANGKSTFMEVIRALLGSYCVQTPSTSFMSSGRASRGIPNDIARFAGARLVCSAETEESHALAESTVKHLTGGDTQVARFLHREFFEFQPTHKILIGTNYRPEISGTDPGIWSRIHMIPFEVSIPPEKQDKDLRKKLLGELPGILNWCLEGCREWQQKGLQPPPEVRAATEDYRAEQNRVKVWLDERCTLQKGVRTQASVLFRDYRAWTEQQAEKPFSQRRFGERLVALGHERVKSNVFHYEGLSLKQEGLLGRVVTSPGADLSFDDVPE